MRNIRKLLESPKTTKDLKKALSIGSEVKEATFYRDIKRLLVTESIKVIDHGQLALYDYSPLSEEIELAASVFYERQRRRPTVEELAQEMDRSSRDEKFTFEFYNTARRNRWRERFKQPMLLSVTR